MPLVTRIFTSLPSSRILSYFSTMSFLFKLFNPAISSLLLILFLFFPFRETFAQGSTVWFESLTNRDGLSSNAVNAVVHDRQGFVWIGTQNGLNVWDGSQVIQFYKSSVSDKGLQSSDITAIAEDPSGQLWIGTNGKGLFRFNRKNGFFDSFSKTVLNSGEIMSLFADSKSRLWIGTLNQGIWSLNPGDTLPVQIPGTKFSHNFSAIAELSDHQILAGSASGLFHISTADNRADRYPSFPGESITSVAQHHEIIFAGTQNGLIIFPEKGNEFKPLRILNSSEISCVLVDSSRGLYIGTASAGLWFYDFKTKKETRIVEKWNENFSSRVQSLFLDQGRNLWIGLLGNGIAKLELDQGGFRTVSFKTEGNRGLTDSDIFAISENKQGELLLGTRAAGVLSWSFSRERFSTLTGTQFSPPSAIRGLYTDSSGTIWTGTSGKGVLALYPDKTSKTIRAGTNPGNSLSSDLIRGIFPGSQNKLYFCTRNGGFTLFDKNKWTFRSFLNLPDSASVLGHNNTWMVIEDSASWVWVATSSGITFLNTASVSLNGVQSQTYLNEMTVLSLLDTHDGFLWGATRNDGLFRFSKKDKTAKFYQTSNGLPSNGIYGLIEDSRKQIWMSTDNGIGVLNPQTGEIFSWSVKNGLPGNEFNAGSFYKSAAGRIYFAGSDGLVSFHPDSISKQVSPSAPLIRKVTILDPKNQTTVFHFWQEPASQLVLPQNLIMMDVDFSGMEFRRPDRLRFSYFLEGLTDDWVSIGSHHNIQFTNLEPGSYTLRIRETSAGLPEKNEVKLAFYIPPAFYQTIWFKLLIIFMISSLVYLAFWLEIRRKLHIERLRLNIASDLHDDVGVLLTKISMKTDLLADETTDDKKRKALDTISNLTRSVIMTMSDSIWSIDSRNDRIANLTDRMKGFCRTAFEEKQIQVEFQTEGLNQEKQVSVDIRQNIFLIFKEAIHNCAKHSDATVVKISLSQSAKHFTMTIADNGSGRESSAKGSGSGLNNMKLRAERIQATLTIKKENGFTVQITRKPLY